MKKAVIIGAGQTGRGFIAPIVKDNGYEITFLDKDRKLIEQLKKEGCYRICYFGEQKKPRDINDFQAFPMDSLEAVEKTAEADIVLVSVFASHIPELVLHFQKAVKSRKKGKLTIFCCENGVNVKRPLTEAGIDAVISEGIIFCTTLRPDSQKLDLISQDYPELPVDGNIEGLQVHLDGMPYEMDFPALIQRKIYTYNFISAIVAYLGSYKGYKIYGEAANDTDIAEVIEAVIPVISRIIAKRYGVSYEVQEEFTNCAVAKFQNKEIYDTIYRNARQAERKLGWEERLLTPLRLAWEYKEDMRDIELVVAAALHYGSSQEKMNAEAILKNIGEKLGEESVQRIAGTLKGFQEQRELNVLRSQLYTL